MDLAHNIVLLYFLLESSLCMRNFHIPHGAHGAHGYFHNLAMQHDNYQHYDSYSSEGVVLRSRRKKFYRARESDYSHEGSEQPQAHRYKWGCKCSCNKCNKPKLKTCCRDYCAQQCVMQSNFLVVPYPVPFMVQPINQSMFPPTTTTTTHASTTSTFIPILRTTSTTLTPESRRTIGETAYTVPFYITKPNPGFKRFRIIQDKKLRRSMGNQILPNQFNRLPKYGIVPIPENLAMSLMQQIRDNNQKNEPLRNRLNLNKNLLDYADRFVR